MMNRKEYVIPRNLAPAAASLPYAAVTVGLYGFSNAWLAVALYHVGMVLFLIRWGRRPGSPGKGGDRWLPAGLILFGAAGGALLFLCWPLLGLEDVSVRLAGVGLTGWKWPVFLIYFSLGNPILEELFWRGLLLQPTRGVDRGDLLFALYHALVLQLFLGWGWVLVAVGSLVAAGWWWRRTVLARGGVALPILSHAAAGVGISVAIWLRTDGLLPG